MRESPIEILPGQYFDSETGLHQNWHRDYDPNIGRYLQSDPVGLAGGINTYAYSFSNPIRYADRDGLTPAAVGFGLYALWSAGCGTWAFNKASDLYPDFKDDKKRHCTASCLATKCTGLIGALAVNAFGVAYEAFSPLQGGHNDPEDIDANVEGILNAFDLAGDCQASCDSCQAGVP